MINAFDYLRGQQVQFRSIESLVWIAIYDDFENHLGLEAHLDQKLLSATQSLDGDIVAIFQNVFSGDKSKVVVAKIK